MKTPPPLSRELEAFLAPHRTVLPLAPSVEARVIARAAAAAEWPESGAGRVMLGRPRLLFAAAAGAVLAIGAGAYAAHAWIGVPSSRDPAHVPSPGASPGATEAPPRAVVLATPETEVPTTIAPEARPRKRIVGKTDAATVLPTNAELQLLRVARQHVTRGDFGDALGVIAEHARRFRYGSLVEEREALRVKSLAGLGRHEEAQRAAATFRARFPHSVFLSTFERMKDTDP